MSALPAWISLKDRAATSLQYLKAERMAALTSAFFMSGV